MSKLGLTVNEKKTRLVKLPIKRLKERIHAEKTSRWHGLPVSTRIDELNPVLRGWANYFSQGPVKEIYRSIDDYTARRLRIWLRRRSGMRGTGYRQYPDQYLYEQLGLIRLLPFERGRSNAKA